MLITMLDCIDKLENFNFKKLIEVAIKENFESELVNDWICNLYYRFDNLTNFNIGFYILLHKDEIIKKRKSNFRFELDSRHKIDKSSSEECKLELQNNFLQIDIFDYLNEFNDANHFWVCIEFYILL